MVSHADKKIPKVVRAQVARKISDTDRQTQFALGKPDFPEATRDDFWSDISDDKILGGLAKLVGPRSWSIFNMLELSEEKMDWLEQDVSSWILSEGYQEFHGFSKGLKVVNDTAERGIKLIQDFVKTTTDEKLRQDLMQVVSQHRENNTAVKMNKKTSNALK